GMVLKPLVTVLLSNIASANDDVQRVQHRQCSVAAPDIFSDVFENDIVPTCVFCPVSVGNVMS
ncbi:hypothetical protein M8C21_006416, partial [Ambrosia artemisiifolia]